MRRGLVAVLGLFVSAVAIGVLLSIVDLQSVWATLRGASPIPLIGTLAVIATQLTLRTVRWRYLLPFQSHGAKPSVARLMPVLAIGYLGNTVLPVRLGEPVRAYVGSLRERLDFASTLGSVLLERFIDATTLAAVAAVAAVVSRAPAWIVAGSAVLGGVALVVTLALLSGAVPRVLAYANERVFSERLRTVLRFLTRIGHGAGDQRRLVITFAVAVSSLAWLLDGVTFWLVGAALDVELTYGQALLIASVTILGTAIPSAPGYVGTFELAGVAVASAVGLPPSQGLAVALVAHFVTTLPLAMVGAASLAAMSMSLRSVAEAASHVERR